MVVRERKGIYFAHFGVVILILIPSGCMCRSEKKRLCFGNMQKKDDEMVGFVICGPTGLCPAFPDGGTSKVWIMNIVIYTLRCCTNANTLSFLIF